MAKSKELKIAISGFDASEVWLDELLEKSPSEIATETLAKKKAKAPKPKKPSVPFTPVDEAYPGEVVIAIFGLKTAVEKAGFDDPEEIEKLLGVGKKFFTDKAGPTESVIQLMEATSYIIEDNLLSDPDLYDSTYQSVFSNDIATKELIEDFQFHLIDYLNKKFKELDKSDSSKTEFSNAKVYLNSATKLDESADTSADPNWGIW